MNEFLFGELESRHEIIFANDRETAVKFFHARVPDPLLYIPDRFIRTDSQGQLAGFYDPYLETFVPEYTADAGIPLSMRVGTDWKSIGNIPLSAAQDVDRLHVSGPRRLPGGS